MGLNKLTFLNSILIILILKLNLSSQSDLLDSCLDLPFNLCSNGGSNLFTPLNKPKSLIGLWTFDDNIAHDYSGNNLDALEPPLVGPSHFVKGYSAYFTGENMMTVRNHKSFIETSDLTISFWIYLLEDSTGNWRTLLNKGSEVKELTPTIMLWPKERRLHVRVGTEVFWNEGLESKGIINMKSWTHIAVVISGQMMQLYINGSLDNQIILKGKVKMNNGELHIGKDPWHSGTKCYLDDLKIHSTALRSQEIEAESAAANPLVGANYVSLGCDSCSYMKALSICQENYHLCSYSELYSGAYLIARKNGWFKFNTDVWARESLIEIEKLKEKDNLGDPNILKLALCCSDR